MKKLKMVGLFGISAIMMSSCAMVKSPVGGIIYTDVHSPMAVTDNSGSAKAGHASASSILGLIATGDASITKAAKSAGITKIHHVDEHATNILGIFAKYEITVYGE